MAQTMPDMSFGPDIFPEFPPLSSATLIIFKKRLRAQTKDKLLFGHSQASVQCRGDPAVVVAINVSCCHCLVDRCGGWTLQDGAEKWWSSSLTSHAATSPNGW